MSRTCRKSSGSIIIKFNYNITIIIFEQTIPIGSSFDSIQLLTEPEINRYKDKDKYKYLHIDLVQVELKPLTA